MKKSFFYRRVEGGRVEGGRVENVSLEKIIANREPLDPEQIQFTALPPSVHRPGLQVSTIFLVIDHNFHVFLNAPNAESKPDDHKPILLETMVFRIDPSHPSGRRRVTEWRFHSEADARRAHDYVVARLRKDPDADLHDYDPEGSN